MAAKKSVSTGRTGTSKAALKVPKTHDTREARNRKLTRKTKYPSLGRFNPIHLMTRIGTDAGRTEASFILRQAQDERRSASTDASHARCRSMCRGGVIPCR